jgi:hypothetical protein
VDDFNAQMVEQQDTPPVPEAPTRDEVIVSLYSAGTPVDEIAGRAGVCRKTVRNVARRFGLPPRLRSHPERDAAVAARYRGGQPVAAIASDVGVSRSRVRLIAARAGIPPRNGWQRRYPIDESAFDDPTEVGWWLIGLIAADGSIHAAENRMSVCQTIEDADVLRAFYAYAGCPDRPLTELKLSPMAAARQLPRRPAVEARIFSKRIVEALASHGVTPRKSRSLELSERAAREPAVWLGVLDGDGSVGIYREGRAPRVAFFGTPALMRQCESFWRDALGYRAERPAARPHAKGLWAFGLGGRKAAAAAQVLLGASPISLRRKRELLTQIAGWTLGAPLSSSAKRTTVSAERRHQWQLPT